MRTGSRLGEVSAIRPRGALKSPRPEAQETFLPSGVEKANAKLIFVNRSLDAWRQMWQVRDEQRSFAVHANDPSSSNEGHRLLCVRSLQKIRAEGSYRAPQLTKDI
jgi:hypothetical protein